MSERLPLPAKARNMEGLSRDFTAREPQIDDKKPKAPPMPIFAPPPVSLALRDRLAPNGVLRAGFNGSNFLLVAQNKHGALTGVAPDLAGMLAQALGARLEPKLYPNPGALADAAAKDEWDIALLGAEPQRAAMIAFTPAYCEIEATYLVREGADLFETVAVDAPGRRIAVTARTAYGLWLERHIRQAELVLAPDFAGALAAFREQGLDALAGLKPRLLQDLAASPGTRLLPGRFMAVQQAIGTPTSKAAALSWLSAFAKAALEQGVIAALIAKHKVEGLSPTVIAQAEPG